MRKIIEYTLASIDGVFAGPETRRFYDYRDDAYYRDGLGLLVSSDAMLMGRVTYEELAKIFSGRQQHPWTDRLTTITKYVFSSTLEHADWDNSVIVRGDLEAEVTKLKQQDGGPLLVFGHGLFAQALLKTRLLDVLDLSIHPFIAGSGGLLFHQDQAAAMKLTATKSFSNIVKLTYEPQYDRS
jgi:dihydrofolate reductase